MEIQNRFNWKTVGAAAAIIGLTFTPIFAPLVTLALSPTQSPSLSGRVTPQEGDHSSTAAIDTWVQEQCFTPSLIQNQCPIDHACLQETVQHMHAVAEHYQLDYHPDTSKLLEAVTEILEKYEGEEALSALQDLAYHQLNRSQFSDIQDILSFALYCPDPNPSDIASLILRAHEETPEPEERMTSPSRTFSTWAETHHFPEGNTLEISYGGGDRYLNSFFERENEGYAMEAGGKGIFVTVHDPQHASSPLMERDWSYATRTPLKNFDTPTVFKATIDPQYLYSVNHNAYEAVLFDRDIDQLTDLERTTRNIRDLPLHQRVRLLAQIIPAGRMGSNHQIDWGPVLWKPVEHLFRAERLKRLKTCLKQLAGMGA